MLDWIVQADEPAKWVTAVVAGLGAVGWLGHRIVRAVRRARVRVREFSVKVARVLDLADHELQPNSGSSLVDKVDRHGVAIDNLTEVVDGIVERLDELTGNV